MRYSSVLSGIDIWSIDMKKLFDILRMIFISFEFLFFLCLIAIDRLIPNLLVELGNDVSKNQEALKLATTVIISICGGSYWIAWKLTAPLQGSNRILYDWPDYWRLSYRRGLSFIYTTIMGIVALKLWISATTLSPQMIGFLFALSLGESLIVLGCLAFASFTIKEIVEE